MSAIAKGDTGTAKRYIKGLNGGQPGLNQAELAFVDISLELIASKFFVASDRSAIKRFAEYVHRKLPDERPADLVEDVLLAAIGAQPIPPDFDGKPGRLMIEQGTLLMMVCRSGNLEAKEIYGALRTAEEIVKLRGLQLPPAAF